MVVTKPDAPGRRGKTDQPPQVKTRAREAGIPVVQPETTHRLLRELSSHPGIAWGVVAAYGMLLPDEALQHFEGGLINVHPSLLPRWRGPSPIEASLLHGDSRTGISLMRMTSSMDAGPVYARQRISLTGSETRLELTDRLAQLGATMLLTHLESILTYSLTPEGQDESQATYSRLISKSDAEIDWQRPAGEIERRIRAFRGWPGSNTTVNGVRITVEAAQVVDATGTPGEPAVIDGNMVIYAADGALRIDTLKPSGKTAMSGPEFARGYLKE